MKRFGQYGIVWTTTKSYMCGTNAILNAVEHYGLDKNIVKMVILEDNFLRREYRDQFRGYNVRFPLIADVRKKFDIKQKGGWYRKFSSIIYAHYLLSNNIYDVLLIWGADVLPVNDFSVYFEIADKLNKVIVGTNEHGTHSLDNLKLEWPYHHTWSVPYADVPFFVPKAQVTILDLMLYYQLRIAEMSNEEIKKKRCGLSVMDSMNYAIKKTEADVFEVSGEQWVENAPYKRKIVETKNKRLCFEKSSTQLYSIHRRYWTEGYTKNYLDIQQEPWKSIGRNNRKIFNELYQFFNTECRVKWTEGLWVAG